MMDCSFEWPVSFDDIENLLLHQSLKSDIFSDEKNQIKWDLRLLNNSNDYVKLFLRIIHTHILDNLQVKYYITFSNNKKQFFESSGTHSFHIFESPVLENSQFVSSFIFKGINSIFKNHSWFKFFCKLQVRRRKSLKNFASVDNDTVNFENLMITPYFSDFILFTSGKEFKVHKNILAARSPIFRALLTNDMTEKKNNFFKIEDIDEKIVQELIRYMYCGKVENLNEIAEELFFAADMYMLGDLKVKCLAEFCKDLKVNNAIRLLCLADEIEAHDIKEIIIDFIFDNIKDIVVLPEYKTFDKPHLMQEILRRVALGW